jgi:hypothetical protein
MVSAETPRRSKVSAETPGHAAARDESGLGLASFVIRGGGRGYVQAFHGLAGDLSDEVKALIEVQDGQSGEFSSRGDIRSGVDARIRS